MKKELGYLVIHCSATPAGREVTADDIRTWHTAPLPLGRGWNQVGYTDLIHLDGTIERLVDNNEDRWVDDWEITNGAAGYNSVSRHVVYAGGCENNKALTPKDTRTVAQRRAMEGYVREFHAKHPSVRIIGHRDFPSAGKSCPSFDVASWLLSIGIRQ